MNDNRYVVTPLAGDLEIEKDGIDFINIDRSGKTELGKRLAPFGHSQFVHPYYGPFRTIIGYSFWLGTGLKVDAFRHAVATGVKQIANNHQSVHHRYFFDDLKVGHWLKVTQRPELAKLLRNSVLPFESYYLFGPNKTLIGNRDREFLIRTISEIRDCLQKDQVPSFYEEAMNRLAKQTTDGKYS